MDGLDEVRGRAWDSFERGRAEGGAGYAMRSCWNCNAAHEHLKQGDGVIVCFCCGRWFFEGVDITEGVEGKPDCGCYEKGDDD